MKSDREREKKRKRERKNQIHIKLYSNIVSGKHTKCLQLQLRNNL